MTDNSARPPEFEHLVGEVHDFTYRHAMPRLTAEQVRRRGLRRRRTRHGAAAAGGGATVVAGVFIAALLTGNHGPAAVVRPAVSHPTSVTSAATPAPKHSPGPATPISGPPLPGPDAGAPEPGRQPDSPKPSTSSLPTPVG